MTTPKLSPAQSRVLQAAADGTLRRQRFYPHRWQADGKFVPRTATGDALVERDLIDLDFDREDGRWIPAVVTDAGRALLANPNQPEGQS